MDVALSCNVEVFDGSLKVPLWRPVPATAAMGYHWLEHGNDSREPSGLQSSTVCGLPNTAMIT